LSRTKISLKVKINTKQLGYENIIEISAGHQFSAGVRKDVSNKFIFYFIILWNMRCTFIMYALLFYCHESDLPNV